MRKKCHKLLSFLLTSASFITLAKIGGQVPQNTTDNGVVQQINLRQENQVKNMLNPCYDYDDENHNIGGLLIPDGSAKNLKIYRINDKTCRIESYQTYYHDIRDKNIFIPEVIDGYKVIEISSRAFAYADIDFVSIPKTVKIVSTYAFKGSTVRSVDFSEGLIELRTGAFSECNNLQSINFIPSTVRAIEDETFYGTDLLELKLHEGLDYIGRYAFANNKSIREVICPKSLSLVNEGGFSGCENLTKVVFQNNETDFAERAFENCYKLTSINLPEELCEIADGAFYNCVELKNVEIPQLVGKIGQYAFAGTSVKRVYLPSFTKEIQDHAFENCTKLEYIEIKNKENFKVGERAFYNCGLLHSFTYKGEKISIGTEAFSKCGSLYSARIMTNDIVNIEKAAFYDCKKLTNIFLKGNKVKIGEYAFGFDCTLESLTIRGYDTIIGDYAFNNCKALNNVVLCTMKTVFGEGAFCRCASLGSRFNLVSRNVKYSNKVFAFCRTLDNVTIKYTNKICKGQFLSCPYLLTIYISKSVKEIDEFAFVGCKSLSKILYGGSKQDWEKIKIHKKGNSELLKAHIVFNYKA